MLTNLKLTFTGIASTQESCPAQQIEKLEMFLELGAAFPPPSRAGEPGRQFKQMFTDGAKPAGCDVIQCGIVRLSVCLFFVLSVCLFFGLSVFCPISEFARLTPIVRNCSWQKVSC